MGSTHNDEKYVVSKRFTRTLKNEIYRYITSMLKMCLLIDQMIRLMNKIMHIT